jgi:hypothetical protein
MSISLFVQTRFIAQLNPLDFVKKQSSLTTSSRIDRFGTPGTTVQMELLFTGGCLWAKHVATCRVLVFGLTQSV